MYKLKESNILNMVLRAEGLTDEEIKQETFRLLYEPGCSSCRRLESLDDFFGQACRNVRLMAGMYVTNEQIREEARAIKPLRAL